MKISNYSLSYGPLFNAGKMDVFQFLSVSRRLGVEGQSSSASARQHWTDYPRGGGEPI